MSATEPLDVMRDEDVESQKPGNNVSKSNVCAVLFALEWNSVF